MTPQTTGAHTDDLTTWLNGDLETNQVFAATNPAAAIPGAPIPPSNPPDTDTAHQLAA